MITPKEIHVYEPKSNIHRPFKLAKDVYLGFVSGRFLAWRLFVRNINAMYRQSILGMAWAFVPPIITALFWIFLKDQKVFSLPDTIIPYTVFVFTGTILWQVFLDSLNIPLRVLSQSKSMLVKINFPREAILLSGWYEVLFNLAIKLGLVIIVFLVLRVDVSFFSILGLIGILCLCLLGYSISLILMPISMLYGDVQKAVGVITPFLFFLTPVIYPIPSSGIIRTIARVNPIATLLDHTRNWLVIGSTDLRFDFFLIIGLSLLIFIVGLVLFRISIPFIIERIGS